jgi:hypothetical protein
MRRIALAATVIAVSVVIGAGAVRAAATGTFGVSPGTVAAGGDVTLTFCGFATGNGGLYTISGPSVNQTGFWGPAAGPSCLTYLEPTAGWAPGKYKIIAYVTDSKGHNAKLGSGIVNVTP